MKSQVLETYYSLKPLIPRPFQIWARRKASSSKFRKSSGIWPISEAATPSAPNLWKGWHSGKQFAFVLTHDVESSRGVAKCADLLEIEKEMGFCSSFNFVANDYSIPNDLFSLLRQEGFEIGVHGLHHRGNLFNSRKVFLNQAGQIRSYLQQWGAVGFRAPSMFHNLDWIGDLQIEYDLSTFDTDPFEPQSDGMGSIFPFLYPKDAPADEGYIEIPYTLPQDFTVFVLLQEKSTDIWKRKMEWIVERGGMALMITHPDYMHFGPNGRRRAVDEYPVELYADFLNYVNTTYKDQFWNALPRSMAGFWRTQIAISRSEQEEWRIPSDELCAGLRTIR